VGTGDAERFFGALCRLTTALSQGQTLAESDPSLGP